jgi:RND family efflux transporter MFP subunit
MKLLQKITLILLIANFSISCSEEQTPSKEIIRPVRYTVVGTQNDSKTKTFRGVATAGNEIELSFRNTGIVSKLNVKAGQRVKKGDLIAKLDNIQAQLSYQKAQSSLNSTKSSMKTAKSTLERSKILYEKGSYSLSEYENAKNSFQSALDTYESSMKTLEMEKDKIEYGFIYAPKNGIIASKNVNVNETVGSGQVIAVLNAGKELNIIVGLPGSLINKVSIGTQPKIAFSAIANQHFTGNVIEISPIINSEQSTFPVKVDITNPSSEIKPGMIASVNFTFEQNIKSTSNYVIVPVKSVGEDGNGNYVFIVESEDDKTGVVKKQTVKIGNLTNQGFEIITGIKEGQKIATAGLQTLLDGQKVRLQ